MFVSKHLVVFSELSAGGAKLLQQAADQSLRFASILPRFQWQPSRQGGDGSSSMDPITRESASPTLVWHHFAVLVISTFCFTDVERSHLMLEQVVTSCVDAVRKKAEVRDNGSDAETDT